MPYLRLVTAPANSACDDPNQMPNNPSPCQYSLVATLSISLTVPLSILADIVWKEKRYGPLFFAGAVPMFCSYFIVALLTHFEDWDPLLDLLR